MRDWTDSPDCPDLTSGTWRRGFITPALNLRLAKHICWKYPVRANSPEKMHANIDSMQRNKCENTRLGGWNFVVELSR